MKHFLLLLATLVLTGSAYAQDDKPDAGRYWNTHLQITAFRLPPPPPPYKPVYVDLDGDGDPDVLKTITSDSIPVMWIDDDDDMQYGDVEGDTYGDCLLVDRNRDGRYGGIGDLIVDWVDTNADHKGDMQVIADFPPVQKNTIWPNGHYMWVLDTDHDGIFNFIDWSTFSLESWAHSGGSGFFPDYSGRSMFMKVHAATNRIEDPRLNWENPFLFYDPDHDGLSEMAVRLVDSPTYFTDSVKKKDPRTMRFSGRINWVSVSVDMDNDNRPGDEFDYDMSLGFRGGGFGYSDQVHPIDMHALPGTDSFFLDPRFRHLHELVYADHSHALPLVFQRGKWKQVWFVYDEDDDCHRWERVEFYDPLDPFKCGTGKGGIDNNPQSDPAGDRGEWDLDNSGKGKLYVSRFDGRIHLYGADWGCWRIDQNAAAYQGWDRRIIKKEPDKFATVKYEDSDHDGFFDRILYDLDGDTTFETVVDLNKLGLGDRCALIDVSHFTFHDYTGLQKKVAAQLWKNAQSAEKVARQYGLNLQWYARWRKPVTIRQQYDDGYWLQFYIYRDLAYKFVRDRDQKRLRLLNQAYYGADWKLMQAHQTSR